MKLDQIVIASRIPPRHFEASRFRGIDACFFRLHYPAVKLGGKEGRKEGKGGDGKERNRRQGEGKEGRKGRKGRKERKERKEYRYIDIDIDISISISISISQMPSGYRWQC